MGCCGSRTSPKAPETRDEKTEVFESKVESKVPETKKEKSEIFNYKSKKDGDAYVLTFTRNKVEITWRKFISLCKANNLSFVIIIKEAILRTKFETIYFNCPPVTKADLDQVFNVAILNAPALRSVTTDVHTFADKFIDQNMVTSFENLNGDCLMVCPVPLEDQPEEIYSSLGPFIRSARIEQQIAFWGLVASDLETVISIRKVWMNTAGTGVSFLHLRLDSRPKYYEYRKFMNSDYYKEKLKSAM